MTLNFSKCQSVLITGASRGLGLQMVKHLVSHAERPKKIIATARNPDGAQELQQLVKSHSDIHILPLDVVSDASIEAAVKEVSSIVGAAGLNCLINNAGILIDSDLNTVTRDAMMKTFESNTVAPLFITKAFLPLLKTAAAAGQGSGMGVHRSAVVNISSLLGSVQLNWGEGAIYKAYAYRVSKSGLNMVTRCLAADLESEGILCTALHPGWVRTDMGGPDAPLSPDESISSMLSVISGLTVKDHGEFLDYSGKNLPW
ncbi:C-factor-like [Colossoma macropomum]|uniref:C-factor-like n=1 Tax=Colossoma macropomum TaxID=42526 RepID=UPI001864A50C|nr:C-factor-like [Colossoma macropomum]